MLYFRYLFFIIYATFQYYYYGFTSIRYSLSVSLQINIYGSITLKKERERRGKNRTRDSLHSLQIPQFSSLEPCISTEFSEGLFLTRASLVALVVKNPPTNAGDLKDMVLIPGLGRSPGGENGNPLQYSCLENSMDRGAWQATVQGVAKVRTRLSMHKLPSNVFNIINHMQWEDSSLKHLHLTNNEYNVILNE